MEVLPCLFNDKNFTELVIEILQRCVPHTFASFIAKSMRKPFIAWIQAAYIERIMNVEGVKKVASVKIGFNKKLFWLKGISKSGLKFV